MQQEHKWLSPEKVYLNLNLAGVGSRFAACFIDGIFQVILIIFSAIVIYYAFWHTYLGTAVILISSFIILFGYFIFFETFWNGQTPGKRIIHIRVVQVDGSAVTFAKVLIRNMIRVIDQIPAMYAIGIIAVFVTKKSQRLGDMAAGTIVIKENVEEAPMPLDFQIKDTPWSGAARLNIHKLSENEFAVLKKYLLRRNTLDSNEQKNWDTKLTHLFCKKLDLKTEEIGPKYEFLTQVAALYQHR